jgi:hypothetical protein
MSGGLFELSAKGAQDLFITGDPQITFFKTVYRRYTNFSRGEFDLNFNNRVDFGQLIRVRIKRLGDLLHRLYLVIELPSIDLVYSFLTIGQVKTLLLEYDIVWDTTRPDDEIFGPVASAEVNILIDLKIQELNAEIRVINKVLKLLQNGGPLDPPVWFQTTGNNDTDVEAYLKDSLNLFFNYDKYDIEYHFIEAERADRVPPLPLTNAPTLQTSLFEKFVAFATGATVAGFDPNSFNDENLFFYFQTDYANYNVSTSANQLDANTVFRAGISNAYGGVPFNNLDAYMIFNASLNTNNSVITSNFDILRIKDQLLDQIRYGLSKNIRQLINIYNSLINDSKFMFYRLFSRKVGGFDTNGVWNNLSLFSNLDPDLSDNFTSDFTVQPTPGEPANLFNPLVQYVQTTVNLFHQDNRTIFRDSLYTDYFNAIDTLWSRTDIGTAGLCLEQITGSPGGTPGPLFQRMYFMNYMPIFENDDIPIAIDRILGQLEAAGNPFVTAFRTELVNVCIAESEIIFPQLTEKICIENDFVSIQKMSNFRTIAGPTGDIILTAIHRQDKWLVLGGQRYLLPEYVARRYLKVLVDFGSRGFAGYQTVKPTLDETVNLFITPHNEIPSYITYQNLGFNQRPGLKINSGSDVPIMCDAASSIYYNLLSDFSQEYTSLYDDEILSRDVYKQQFGAELLKYITEISTLYLGLDPNNPQPISYYFDSTTGDFQTLLPDNNGAIGDYLNTKLLTFLAQLDFFDSNYGLLTMRDLVIQRADFFYQTFNIILNFIIDQNIEKVRDPLTNLLVYYHVNHGMPDDPVLLIQRALIDPKDPNYDPSEPHQTITDILNISRSDFEELISTPINPFDPKKQKNKYALWNSIWLPEPDFIEDVERQKYNDLFLGLTPQYLFTQSTIFNVKYNGMLFETDSYDYMSDIIIEDSFFKDVPSLVQGTVIDTNQIFIDYFELQELQRLQLIDAINGTPGSIGLRQILTNALRGGQPANFAWIKRIGHYIIEKMWIQIGDQIIDTQFGEWLEIWHQLTKRQQKERGYNILIGDVPELTSFDTIPINAYELIIPLQYWFCHHIGNSLPLVALQHTHVDLFFKLKEFNELCYFDSFTNFLTKPKLRGHMLAEYIYVEEEERERIVKSKNEYLIEQLQYNGDIELTKNSPDEDLLISTRFYFKNPIKEYYWVIQRHDFIDGSMPNGERQYHNYSFNFDVPKINMMDVAKIRFNSRDRETFRDDIYFNYIVPREYHNSTPSVGINVYSFSLNPEKIQPSGQANLSFIDDAGIQFKLKQVVLDTMTQDNIRLRWPIYAKSYNFLRVMSGLSGLVFFF